MKTLKKLFSRLLGRTDEQLLAKLERQKQRHFKNYPDLKSLEAYK